MTDTETEDPVENNVTSESLIDIDTFVTLDGVDPVWINGLIVYLSSRGGTYARSLTDWRGLLATYQALR